MILVLQVVLMVLLLGLSLLVFLMVRQVGVLSFRLGREMPIPSTWLEVGTRCPGTEFQLMGGSGTLKLPYLEARESFLLFLSFSCPVCRLLLDEFGRLPAEVTRRLILFLLDGNPRLGFRDEVERLDRQSFPMVEAQPLAEAFKIQHAPFLYVVGADGLIQEAVPLYTFDELVDVLREYASFDLKERGVDYARAQ